MSQRYSVAIDVLLQSPLHISALAEARYLPGEVGVRRIRITTERIGVPLTLTREAEVVLPHPVMVGEGSASFVKYTSKVPVIPSNGIKGRLRRCAAELLIESVVARGMTVTPRAYNTLSSGAPDASLDRASSSMDQVLAGRAHPFFGVFGGTSYALEAGLVTHEGYPVCDSTAHLTQTPALSDAPVLREMDMTSIVTIARSDDIKAVRNVDLLSKGVGIEAASAYIESIMAGRTEKAAKAAESSEPGKKTELAAIAALQVANPGLTFALRFDLEARTPAHLGMLLLALQRLLNIGQIGGKASRGYGRFLLSHSRLYKHEDGRRSIDGIPIWSTNSNGSYDFSDHPQIEQAVNAGHAFVESVDAAELEVFAAPDANKLLKRERG